MEKKIKKVVLAYSGGLDTSIIIPWLKENYDNCEVIAVSGDVGQGTELEGLEEKAKKTGASKLYVLDLKKEFIEDYIFPTVQAGAKYEDMYLLGTSFARPVIAKAIVDIAKKEGADAICHGCTGKGNDQVRFELTIKAFAPEMKIIAPWRIWDLKSREEEIEYAEAHQIPLKISRETNYSKDKNLWHLSHEGLDLEDPANEPQYEKPGFLELGVSPVQAPDKPTYITIHFEKGKPFSSVIKRITRGAPCNAKELDEMSSDVPTDIQYLMLANIRKGQIDSDLPYLKDLNPKYEKYCVSTNNLILSKNGFPYKVAIPTVGEGKRILANGNLYIIEVDEEKANPYYLKVFFESEQGIAALKSITVGTAMLNIGVEDLKNLEIPVPSLEVQNRIALKYLAKLDEIKILQMSLDKAEMELANIFNEEADLG